MVGPRPHLANLPPVSHGRDLSAGSKRGGHYHKETKELFFFIEGEIKITIEHLKKKQKQELTVHKGDILMVEPFEVHTFEIIKDAKWINILSVPMDKKDPDFHYV